MIFEIAIAFLLGILAGIFAGLMPGIHTNLISLFLLVNSAALLNYASPFALGVFIVSMSIAQTFFDFLPSIFLGAPDEDTALSVLPGHELLLEGKGYSAVNLALKGCFYGLLIVLLITPLFVIGLPKFYSFIKNYMALILVAISFFLLYKEKEKIWAFAFFLLSGVLGIAVLNIYTLKQPLFPLLSGLFGLSLLSISFFKNVKIPKQNIEIEKISKKETLKALGAGTIAGSLCSFLPGLGASQAAVIGSEISGKSERKSFLVLLGIINIIVMALSFVALYAIGKTRTGSAVFLNKILSGFSLTTLIYFIIVIIISGVISYILSIKVSKIFVKAISKVNYRALCLFVIIFIVIMTIIFSSMLGLIVLAVSTLLGISASFKGVKKMFLMGCLLLPTIIYFL